MVALMLPAGHFAGEFYTTPGAEAPEYYEVRLGREIFRLDPPTYVAWALAHGDPEFLAGGGEANRLSLAAAAREAGIGDVNPQLSQLQGLGLVTQILPVDNHLQRFAETYRVVPMALGLGNSADNTELIQIGHPGQVRLSVPPVPYNVWVYADAFGSLWETCGQLASQLKGQSGQVASPMEVLKRFLEVLPAMIAVSCAYLDRR